MSQYRKFYVAMVAAILSAVVGELPSGGHLTQAAAINVILAALGAVAVYVGPNVRGVPGWLGGGYTKMILAGLTAAATAVATLIGAHGSIQAISLSEWEQVIVAVASTLLVGLVPNAPPSVAAPTPGGRP